MKVLLYVTSALAVLAESGNPTPGQNGHGLNAVEVEKREATFVGPIKALTDTSTSTRTVNYPSASSSPLATMTISHTAPIPSITHGSPGGLPPNCPKPSQRVSHGDVCKYFPNCGRFKAQDGCSMCTCRNGQAWCIQNACRMQCPKPGHCHSAHTVCEIFPNCPSFKEYLVNDYGCVDGKAHRQSTGTSCPREDHRLGDAEVCVQYAGCTVFMSKDKCKKCHCLKGHALCEDKKCRRESSGDSLTTGGQCLRPKEGEVKYCVYAHGKWQCTPDKPQCPRKRPVEQR